MKFLSALIICLLTITSSCSKSSPAEIQTGNLNNQVKATLAIGVNTPFTITAIGDNSYFNKMIDQNGDTIFTISGHNKNMAGTLVIELFDTPSAGSYTFGISSSIRQHSDCFYLDQYSSIGFYTTNSGTPSGTLIIDSLSANYIKGSFEAFCSNIDGTTMQIRGGSFKGNF